MPRSGRHYEPAEQRLTLWASTQVPHKVKRYVGLLLHRPPREVRVIAPDVGGGFGQKVEIWPEDIALSYLAMQLAQPIKWIEERWENMLAYHGHGYSAEVEAAARRDGTILGMRFRIIADVGAYFLNSSPGPPVNAAHRVAGPYAIHTMDVECLGVLTTNLPPGLPGAGDPRALFSWSVPSTSWPATWDSTPSNSIAAILSTRSLSLHHSDGIDLRFRQFCAGPGAGPGVGRLCRRAPGSERPGCCGTTPRRGPGHRRESLWRERRDEGEPRAGTRRADRPGHGIHGSLAARSGTETTFAQIVADELGVCPADVQVLHGDTDMLASGQGTFASRGMTLGGSAMYEGLQQVRRKMSLLAAHLLDCRPEDILFQDGKLLNETSPEHALTFAAVAAAAQQRKQLPPDMEVGLEFPVHFILRDNPFGFGAHVAVVEVDRDTGALKVLRYVAVHDCGRVINPKLLEGQVYGAIAQGLGQALGEGMLYSRKGSRSLAPCWTTHCRMPKICRSYARQLGRHHRRRIRCA